jgi:hypothetical protein
MSYAVHGIARKELHTFLRRRLGETRAVRRLGITPLI